MNQFRRRHGFLVGSACGAALFVFSASGCGHGSDRQQVIMKLRQAFAAHHVQSRVVDRNSGLVGPPYVKHCDPPLVAWRLGDAAGRHGFATIYVCQSDAQARTVSVPQLHGQHFRSANVVAVASADEQLARDVQAAIRRVR